MEGYESVNDALTYSSKLSTTARKKKDVSYSIMTSKSYSKGIFLIVKRKREILAATARNGRLFMPLLHINKGSLLKYL